MFGSSTCKNDNSTAFEIRISRLQRYVMKCQIIEIYFKEFMEVWQLLKCSLLKKNISQKVYDSFHNKVERCKDYLIIYLIIIIIIIP